MKLHLAHHTPVPQARATTPTLHSMPKPRLSGVKIKNNHLICHSSGKAIIKNMSDEIFSLLPSTGHTHTQIFKRYCLNIDYPGITLLSTARWNHSFQMSMGFEDLKSLSTNVPRSYDILISDTFCSYAGGGTEWGGGG